MDIPCKQGIYLLTNLVNGKIYIGKSVDLRQRMALHKSKAKRNSSSYISRAIKKHGWENFEVSILESFDEIDNDVLLTIEAFYIEKFNSTNPKIGYNLLAFGTNKIGFKLSSDTCKKISIANKGKKHSEETKRKISLATLGEKNHFFGKTHTSKTKEKLSEMFGDGRFAGSNNPMWGRRHSEESLKKMSESHKGNGKRPVKQIDKKTGEVIKIWDSAKDAAIGLKGSSENYASSITRTCGKSTKSNGGRYLSAYGFRWEYALKDLTFI